MLEFYLSIFLLSIVQERCCVVKRFATEMGIRDERGSLLFSSLYRHLRNRTLNSYIKINIWCPTIKDMEPVCNIHDIGHFTSDDVARNHQSLVFGDILSIFRRLKIMRKLCKVIDGILLSNKTSFENFAE